jgi:chromosome segregation ATPase
MSFDSRTIKDESNNSVVTYHHHDTHGEPFGHYISSVILNIRQLQTDLHSQHQHDKGALIELNKSFQLFVDRVQLLQSENMKYRAAIADLRGQSSGIGSIDARWGEGYLAINHDLSVVRNAKVDYKWDFELCQQQIAIYNQLIATEQQRKDKRSSILEEELKQSASTLNGLRTSYAEVQQKVDRLHAECDGLLKQYLTLTHDWCTVKKQGNKFNISIETLKSYILFYKNLRSYTRK